MSDEARVLSSAPDLEHPGWLHWRAQHAAGFNEAVLGKVIVRAESADSARVRIFPTERLTNIANRIHGGATLGFIDVALFAASRVLRGVEPVGALTLGVDAQFIGSGDPDRPLDAVVEVLRETGRLLFLRGLVVQDDELVVSFSATIRKPSRR